MTGLRFAGIVGAIALGLLAPWPAALAQCKPQGAVNETFRVGNGRLFVDFYYPTAPGPETIAALKQIVKARAPQLIVYDKPPARETMPQATWAAVQVLTADKIVRPSLDYLGFKGRTLSAEQRQAVLGARGVIALAVFLPGRDFRTHFALANSMVADIAEHTGALVLDEDTRDFYSAEGWRAARAADPPGQVLMGRHIAIHQYRNGNYLRSVSIGMQKFGAPDLVVQEQAASEAAVIGDLLALIAQQVADGGLQARAGRSELHESTGASAQVRVRPTGSAAVCLYEARPEPGDAENRLIRLGFDLSPGSDDHSRRYAFLAQYFGREPSVIQGAPTRDAELAAASAKARTAMPALRADVQRGLRPNERLAVKAPFATADGGREYMWIDVATWSGDEIRGVLMSEPRNIPRLKAGQEIRIKEADFYDYMRWLPNGSTEGNETGKVLDKRAGRTGS